MTQQLFMTQQLAAGNKAAYARYQRDRQVHGTASIHGQSVWRQSDRLLDQEQGLMSITFSILSADVAKLAALLLAPDRFRLMVIVRPDRAIPISRVANL
jgi:hypothetical protein